MTALSEPAARDDRRVPVYVRSLPARICHWIIFLCFLILVFTGLYIARPFFQAPVRGQPFLMGTMRLIHFYTALTFDIAFGAEIGLILIGGFREWGHYVPFTRKRWSSIGESLKFYVFLRRRPPPSTAIDGLDGLIFLFGFAVDVLIICTGFALWADITSYNSPLALLRFLIPIFGGLATARWLHHVLMWVGIAYVLQHVIRVFMLSAVRRDGTVDSMVSGYKYLPAWAVEEADERRRH